MVPIQVIGVRQSLNFDCVDCRRVLSQPGKILPKTYLPPAAEHVIASKARTYRLIKRFLDRQSSTSAAREPIEPIEIDAKRLSIGIAKLRADSRPVDALVDCRAEPGPVRIDVVDVPAPCHWPFAGSHATAQTVPVGLGQVAPEQIGRNIGVLPTDIHGERKVLAGQEIEARIIVEQGFIFAILSSHFLVAILQEHQSTGYVHVEQGRMINVASCMKAQLFSPKI